MAKAFLRGAEGDQFLITQARHYKALAQAWAFGQREKEMVSMLVIP
jgi:hypothetical protein